MLLDRLIRTEWGEVNFLMDVQRKYQCVAIAAFFPFSFPLVITLEEMKHFSQI
jgi:hypothetical protein